MSSTKIDLSTLGPEQLVAVKRQFDQELDHFNQSLQALNIASNKFTECIEDIKQVSKKENDGQQILIPASSSLYIPGKIVNNQSFMVDVGTGYYIEKNREEAITFYQAKVDKLKKESIQLQDIIKEKAQVVLMLEQRLRQLALQRREEAKTETAK
ncbi:hypothetical protein TBLA_0C06320 [Henningerozyma blattae CBS 6284]|uniref:Prefoldin subunit 5 n=1 Tax=Henningerozyma blattae (strain ATCC 34711 / CBS 6284 / DSM 70876 / NBRC 10599 / NRRL Y-10934 / UCD 77-7) TaxID=1071380 RepID=I2H225_HENB6|nr:hypothetical protein TBLA_0C06320 [Tetrapisispora blattae CBS 6284]CCH60427.1 hypothetical protein TBLA_0C06320 [Tetrapisispora blattae CBS 6284]